MTTKDQQKPGNLPNGAAKRIFAALVAIALSLAMLGCGGTQTEEPVQNAQPQQTETTAAESATEPEPESESTPAPDSIPEAQAFDLASVPAYSGSPYAEINGNVPAFAPDEITATSFESYSELDSLGRCGVAVASIGRDIMPTEERGSIGEVKPSGWHLSTYDKSIISDRYLYNRCHLIGYQIAGENANAKNLITGTRYLNVTGMLPFENRVADYVESTGNHVMYRVTPVFEGENLVASGVQMEAYSVEDSGAGVSFNVYCYNVQPNVAIDYATGDNGLAEGVSTSAPETESDAGAAATGDATEGASSNAAGMSGSETGVYVLNTNTKKFHVPDCSSVSRMSAKNRQDFNGSREEIIAQGYDPCKNCNP